VGESVRRRSRGERARGKDHTAPMAVVGIGVVVHEVVSIEAREPAVPLAWANSVWEMRTPVSTTYTVVPSPVAV